MPISLDQFMNALSGQESGGDYDIPNQEGSGAYGKYQIMPQYWPEFAQAAGLSSDAPMTPSNQERVARHRVSSLYQQYGNWEDVAAVWYSGRPLTGMSAQERSKPQFGGPSIEQYASQVVGRIGSDPFPSTVVSGGPVNGRASTSQRVSWAGAPITQGFGPTDEKLDSGYNGYANFNKGLDYGIPVGTPIDATTPGIVVGAGDMGDGWGISVKVQDANGFIHNYGHLDSVNVEVGDTVGAGTFVGASGNTGRSTGPHLSYDVADPSGNWVDPSPWVSGGSVPAQMLPFDEKTYLEKYTRYNVLGIELQKYQTPDPLTGEMPAMPPGLAEEYFKLEYELSEYDRIKAEGGSSLDDDLARLGYLNQNNPAMIDAQNSANAWARQQQINAQAQSGTANEMGEQRLTQDSANAETEAYRSASQFTAPMGFRVGATDLPTQEEVFAKQLDMASRNLPEVKPIPYSQPYPSGPRGATPYQVPKIDMRQRPATAADEVWQGPPGPDMPQPDIQAGASVFRNMTAPPFAPEAPAGRGFLSPALTNPPPLPGRLGNPLLPVQPDTSAAGTVRGAGRRFIGSLFGRN